MSEANIGARPRFLRFSYRDRIIFTKRLGMILRSGMPIIDGLHMIAGETKARSHSFIYSSLIADVSNGQPLSAGLAKFDRIFGEFTISVVRVGEVSGTLHENLNYLSEELKKKQILKRKVFGALVYPAVILAATASITIMLTVFIFPKIVPIFQSVKATLPWSTRALITVSNFLSMHGYVLIAAVFFFSFALVVCMRKSKGFHIFADSMLMRLPLFGQLSQYYNVANICRTLGVLLRSDVRIAEAFELVATSTRNLVYRRELLEARVRIIRGQKLSSQFERKPVLYPAMLSQMIVVGESTGNLESTLSYLSDSYEEDINELTKNLTTLLEPILMLIMGLVVGFIAISIISPIYSITSSLNPH